LLNIGYNELQKIENLGTLDKLEVLKLRNNKIAVLSGLREVESLKLLNLSTCMLRKNAIRSTTSRSCRDLRCTLPTSSPSRPSARRPRSSCTSWKRSRRPLVLVRIDLINRRDFIDQNDYLFYALDKYII
jgi:hypothetical protein